MSNPLRNFLSSFALLAIAVSMTSPVRAQQGDDIRVVYRVDIHPPSEVFVHGLFGRGSSVGVLGHALEGECDDESVARSAWVSTTASQREASRFALQRLTYEGASGSDHPLWLYEIRPDATYISVPGVVRQAIDAAERGVGGYVPAHAQRIRSLMNGTAIDAQEVLTQRVLPANIVRATAVWREATLLMQGPPVANQRYVAADTQARQTVDDLATYVPIGSIGTGPAVDAPTCSMICDRATPASSRAVVAQANLEGFCAAYPKTTMTLEKLMILVD